MRILSIETSCDETAIAILEARMNETTEAPQFSLLGNALYSQAHTHAEFGGVFPMLAKREHAKNLIPLLTKALHLAEENGLQYTTSTLRIDQKKIKEVEKILEREQDLLHIFLKFVESTEAPQIDAIAVTQGPGLEPALWVGVSFAKALSYIWNVPVIPVNHMEGHIVSVLMGSSNAPTNPLQEPEADTRTSSLTLESTVQFPALALLISGGHTELVEISNWHHYTVIGRTRDDAVGEAFDKVARILGLPYPGGPHISKLAAIHRGKDQPYTLPRPMINSDDLDFSFSGIKTAVLYLAQKLKMNQIDDSTDLTQEMKESIAEEFENAVTDVLVEKTRKALIQTLAKTLIIGGGVVANSYIRSNFEHLIVTEFPDVRLFVPSIDMSTDNAVMIAIAGYLRALHHPEQLIQITSADIQLRAQGNLSL